MVTPRRPPAESARSRPWLLIFPLGLFALALALYRPAPVLVDNSGLEHRLSVLEARVRILEATPRLVVREQAQSPVATPVAPAGPPATEEAHPATPEAATLDPVDFGALDQRLASAAPDPAAEAALRHLAAVAQLPLASSRCTASLCRLETPATPSNLQPFLSSALDLLPEVTLQHLPDQTVIYLAR